MIFSCECEPDGVWDQHCLAQLHALDGAAVMRTCAQRGLLCVCSGTWQVLQLRMMKKMQMLFQARPDAQSD